MKNKILLFITTALFFIVSAAPVHSAPKISEYQAVPFWLDGGTVPQVLLVVERDWKIFYPAYNNLSDLDGDGKIDIGFNPAVTYVGYFDSDSCYVFDTKENLFVRVGDTKVQDIDKDLNDLVPDVIKKVSKDTNGDKILDAGIKVPPSKHGVCNRAKATLDGSGEWHGNWLNFSTTGRIDAIRKVLYGGKRYIDTPDKTVLEANHFIPSNGFIWGGEIPADDLWEEYYKTSPWYDVPSFTGYLRPESQTMHFWARASKYTDKMKYRYKYTQAGDMDKKNEKVLYMWKIHTAIDRKMSTAPLLQVAANVPVKINFHPVYMTPLRIWDWIGDHHTGSQPSGYNIGAGLDENKSDAFIHDPAKSTPNKPVGHSARLFAVRVEVCKKGNLGRSEKCRNYGDSYKPIGLLQEYGENQSMYFGLLTGTLDNTTRWEGGVIRHHIQSFDKYVDYTNGMIKRPGLIDTIDRLMITGTYGYSLAEGRLTDMYTDGTQAGNPLGEMLYEGIRYMARNVDQTKFLEPSKEYKPSKEVRLPEYSALGAGYKYDISKRNELVRLVNPDDWKPASSSNINGRPSLNDVANRCAKPIILVLSEVFPDHDRNTYPNLSDLDNVPLLRALKSSKVPQKLNFEAYLDMITNYEQLSTSSSGGKYFFWPTLDRGVCLPASFDGLKNIDGHCPSEPSLQGGYHIAAVAYYAHTHDIFNLTGKSNTSSERNVDFYAVGLPPNFPDITFTVDEKRTITLMPITAAHDSSNPSTRLRTLINFFVDFWETDAHNRAIRAKFATNFEFNMTPAWSYGSSSNNMERDIFNHFDIILLTDRSTPAHYRESVPVFINSGPLRTKDLDLWLQDKAKGVFPDRPSQKYYYAFKNPNPNDGHDPLDVSKHKVLGIAIENNTHGSHIHASGQGGYTISGVTRPGAYLDAGYNGDDQVPYLDAQCTTILTDQDGKEIGKVPPGPVVITPDMRPDYYTACESDYWISWNEDKEDIRKDYPDRRGLPPGYRNPDFEDPLLTPWECPFAGYTDANRNDEDVVRGYGIITKKASEICGYDVARVHKLTRYIQVRSFEFDEKAKKIAKLPNPLWLAAKYGGFKDSDISGPGLGVPDKDIEWKRGGTGPDKDDPYNYFGVDNISELPEQLGKAFEAIYNSVATGTANAASINSVLGGGLSIQTQYLTEYEDPQNPQIKIAWAGAVYALFVDKWGNLREDTNGDKRLQVVTSPRKEEWNDYYPDGGSYREIGDRIVHIVPSKDSPIPVTYLCRDPKGDNNGGFILPVDKHPDDPDSGYPPSSDCQKAPSIYSVALVWNTAQLLSEMDVNKRKVLSYFGTHQADGSEWWDPNGIVLEDRKDEKYEFKRANAVAGLLHDFMGQENPSETADLVDYIRGVDFPKYRNRTARLPWKPDTTAVWRLGDVINSKPVIVADPASNYHLVYGDKSYAEFKSKYARRRNMAYFGSNDGMLHAVNLGYFGSLSEGMAGYHANPDPNDTSKPKYEIGEEVWSFIPTSVLPHLQWLADRNYSHSYMVDLRPYVVDMRDKAGNWRTIMLVGLRLGGRTIEMVNAKKKPEYSFSEIFALDITDPERPPKFLWRYSTPYIGMTVAVPLVICQDEKWFVVIPSGPTSDDFHPDTGEFLHPKALGGTKAYYGESSQNARLVVLNAFSGDKKREDLVVPEANSFFTDTFLPQANYTNVSGNFAMWSHHVAYLGLTAKTPDSTGGYSKPFDTGAVYRLQLADETTGEPFWAVPEWKLKRMYNTQKPVTGAVNSTYDAMGNLWVMFGTGRIWGKDDLAPCGSNPDFVNASCCDNHEQYIYGLKEPLTADGNLTFEEIKDTDSIKIVDVSDIKVLENGALKAASAPANPVIAKYGNHENLYSAMLAQDATGKPVVRGYKRKMETWKMLPDRQLPGLAKPGKTMYEVVSTQPKINALANGRSNVAYTSFQTSDDPCRPSGYSYLHVLDSFTGLPAPYMKHYMGFNEGDTSSAPGESQVTGVKDAGKGLASEPVVLKTSAGTIYRTTSADSSNADVHEPIDLAAISTTISWREVLDLGFDLVVDEDNNALYQDLLK